MVCDEYEKATPLALAMVKKIDGRTMTGLVRQVSKLQENEATKTDGDNLDLHRKDLLIAASFHRERWIALSSEEKHAAKVRMQEKVPIDQWQLSVKQMILNEEVADARRDGDWETFENAVDPFRVVPEFDLMKPSLGGLVESSETSKINNFSRVYFKEFLVASIAKGDKAKEVVLEGCQRQVKRHENFDVFDCSDTSRDAMQHYRNTWQFLELILDPECSVTDRQDFFVHDSRWQQ